MNLFNLQKTGIQRFSPALFYLALCRLGYHYPPKKTEHSRIRKGRDSQCDAVITFARDRSIEVITNWFCSDDAPDGFAARAVRKDLQSFIVLPGWFAHEVGSFNAMCKIWSDTYLKKGDADKESYSNYPPELKPGGNRGPEVLVID
jgi:hypothetical protein